MLPAVSDQDIEDMTAAILKLQPRLSPYVFDEHGVIIDDMRQKILWRVNLMFERTLGQFDGVNLLDIYLCGSSAGYMWREESDLDIWLKVKIDPERFFIANEDKAQKFLAKQLAAHRHAHLNLYGIGRRLLDVKISHHPLETLYGVYSLLQNCWLRKPDRNLTSGMDAQQIAAAVKAKIAECQNLVNNAGRDAAGRISLEELEKIGNFYHQLTESMYQNPTGYIIYKLLRRSKITIELYQFIQDETAKTLSIDSSRS